MRWYQQIETYEYLQSEDYNRLWYRMGEMGEIIEWLLCNYFSDVDITGNAASTGRNIKVTCWGSYAGQNRINPSQSQIVIRSQPGARLFRGLPPVRMQNAAELREFLSNETNWDRDRQNISALLRAPPEMDIDMVDVDQAFTGYTIRPGTRGMKYRYAARSIRDQHVRKSLWKKEYCGLFQSQKYNNKLKQLAPSPRHPRVLPDSLRPQIIQFLFLLVFLCFFLANEFDLKENYELKIENPFVPLKFVYGILGCYFIYLTFCISLQRSLGIFGIRQEVPLIITPPRQTALPIILQSVTLQIFSFLFLFIGTFSGMEFDSGVGLIISLAALVYVVYLFGGEAPGGARNFTAFLCGMAVLYFPITLVLGYVLRL